MADPVVRSQPTSSRNPVTSILFQISYTFIVVVLVFAGLEFGVRVIQTGRHGPKSQRPQALRDRWSAWRNNPAYGRVDIQHNAQGFRRDRVVSLDKPPNTVRIFFLGGSAAYGAEGGYPDIENRYSRIYNNQLIDYDLEQKLNANFPSKQWEVINAATNGYRLHQQLALIQSVLLRYQPDYVISMDGYNDLIGMYNYVRQGNPSPRYDVYATTLDGDEFNALANPQSFHSMFVFTSAWLRSNSVLVRAIQNRLQWRNLASTRQRSASANREVGETARLGDLNAEQQAQFAFAQNEIGYYTNVARQIHGVLALDGIRTVLLLQPELILSHKQFTESEKRMYEYDRDVGGPLYVYAFQRLYSEVSRGMAEAANKDGFTFLNLEDVFDHTSEQTFSDFAHLTPGGNRIIADRLFVLLHDSFEEAARKP